MDVIYPTEPRKDVKGSEKKVLSILERYPVELIAIGNGTASRETEQFIADMIQQNNLDVPYLIVNEAVPVFTQRQSLHVKNFPICR